MKPLTERERLNKLRLAIARAVTDLQRIANWRADCHDFDGDMGHPSRDFADTEEWERLEKEAKRIKLALATAEPPLEVEDSSEANEKGYRSQPGADAATKKDQ